MSTAYYSPPFGTGRRQLHTMEWGQLGASYGHSKKVYFGKTFGKVHRLFPSDVDLSYDFPWEEARLP